MNRHRRMLARALSPARAWIDTRALPEVLRYLRIAPIVAPEHLALKAGWLIQTLEGNTRVLCCINEGNGGMVGAGVMDDLELGA